MRSLTCLRRYFFCLAIFLAGVQFFSPLLQAQTYTVKNVGGWVEALNEKGEYVYRLRTSHLLVLPDSAYGLPAGPTRLFALNGSSTDFSVNALNDLGVVVGMSRATDGVNRMTIWTSGVPTAIDPTDSSFTAGVDINNLGHIIGVTNRFPSDTVTSSFGFFYNGLQFFNLQPEGFSYDTCPRVGGFPAAINNSDASVGSWSCQSIGAFEIDYFIWQGTSPSHIDNPDFILVCSPDPGPFRMRVFCLH